MALTASNPFASNKKAPDFKLLNTLTETYVSLQESKGSKGTLILFICNHCPYVIHINEFLVKLANEYQAKGINFIAISSNDIVNYPQDSPDKMKELALEVGYPFPYLYDETQEVAKAYDAACTPDIFLFDKNLNIHYHGQLDDSRPGNSIPVSGKDLKNAMNLLLEEQAYTGKELPSMGCGIKWK
ncbi:thioredoxin family protein [Flavicella marina]|uniref:thioredoxin family protein n=1 Tax=Flavicella marina TaxID=1475951 RepID=UPI001264B425|nr:thioredoxin family protein [Flavicella marina]